MGLQVSLQSPPTTRPTFNQRISIMEAMLELSLWYFSQQSGAVKENVFIKRVGSILCQYPLWTSLYFTKFSFVPLSSRKIELKPRIGDFLGYYWLLRRKRSLAAFGLSERNYSEELQQISYNSYIFLFVVTENFLF